jgi:ribosomal protein S14
MIFIAGVAPKIKVLDQNPRRCSVCGLHQAYYKRTDHYLSLFFIPIFRVKKGKPFIICDHCEQAGYGLGPDVDRQQPEEASRCKNCGQGVAGDFKFCPYCGKRI